MDDTSLTLFTTCKPFKGEAAIMQVNAIKSWKSAGFDILFLGDEEGVQQQAENFGATYVPIIERSEQGMPKVHSLWHQARANTDSAYIAYINADIILPQNFAGVVNNLLKQLKTDQPVLITARRKNIPISTPLNFDNNSCQKLHDLDHDQGAWDQGNAIDIFIASRDLFLTIPDLVIGRMSWDNWLLWKACDSHAVVLDMSYDTYLLHPIHGYGATGLSLQSVSQNIEAQNNRVITENQRETLDSATTHYFINGEIVQKGEQSKALFHSKVMAEPKKEMRAGLSYIHTHIHDLTLEQITGILTVLVARMGGFYPNYSQAIGDIKSIKSLLQTYHHRNSDDIFHQIEQIICTECLDVIEKNTKNKRKLYIFGAGLHGQRAMELLARRGIVFAGFIDNDPLKVGRKIKGKTVTSSQCIEDEKPYILIASLYAAEIVAQLKDFGLKSIEDFIG